ncbi:MAG: CPBP family intramembrane glutamic endopeptidase [Rubrobacteraceae bacterium]|jgi:membrane protease YdiL (CAAX protease family)
MWPFIEEGRRRPRAMWRLLVHFSAFVILVAVVTSLLATAWFILGPAGAEVGSGEAANSPSLFLISVLASAVAIFISLILAGRFLDKRPFRAYGFDMNRGWWLDLGFGLFLGAFLMCGVFLTQYAFGWVAVTNSFESNLSGTPFALAILLPLAVFLCVGVYEEALSRGYQLTNLAEGLNFPVLGGPKGAVVLAWVITSGVFGILHLGNPNASFISTTNIALAGILLGVGYVLTGQLAIPIGVHITWNFFQGNVFGFPVSGLEGLGATFLSTETSGPELWTGGVFGPEAGLLVPIAIVVGSLMTFLWVRFRHGEAGILASIAEAPEPELVENEKGSEV